MHGKQETLRAVELVCTADQYACLMPMQALFCLGDLVWGHAQLQEQLAGQLAAAPAQVVAGRAQQQQPIPYLQAVLRVMLHGADELERAGASHLLAAFCQDNNLGQLAVLSTVVYAGGCCSVVVLL
jgi:hypothetical protein